jgi:small nuclear ribonucleoprotein G
VIGTLRGYDVFLNIVLDDAVEEKAGGGRERIGMVVRGPTSPKTRILGINSRQVIRGNSVVMLEAMERIGDDQRQQRG